RRLVILREAQVESRLREVVAREEALAERERRLEAVAGEGAAPHIAEPQALSGEAEHVLAARAAELEERERRFEERLAALTRREGALVRRVGQLAVRDRPAAPAVAPVVEAPQQAEVEAPAARPAVETAPPVVEPQPEPVVEAGPPPAAEVRPGAWTIEELESRVTAA